MKVDSPFVVEALPHWDADFIERAEVRPEYSRAAHLSDARERGYQTKARARQERAVASALNARSAGLVSVPTTWEKPESASEEVLFQEAGPFSWLAGKAPKGLADDCVRSNAAAAAKGVADELGAFTLDAPSRRLAMLRMAVGFAARAHAVSEKGHRNDVPWMVTLTYRPGVQWKSTHLSKAMLKCRDWCRKKGFAFRYVWIAEIQDGKRRADGQGRDVIHYHAVIWLPVGVRAPHFDRRGWWPHGMTRKDAPPVGVNNPVGYLLHYLKKDKDLSAMPKGARAYGCGGLDHSLRRARRWLRLPAFVQGNSSIHDDWRRADGGGWIDPHGARYASEFEATIVGGVRCLVRVHRHPCAIEASGPFSWLTDRATALVH